MDVLTDVLNSLQLRGSLYCRSELSAPWALHFLAHPTAVFHVVDRGQCWLKVLGDEAAIQLSAGDLLVLPQGSEHLVADALGSTAFPPVRMDYDAYRECQIWHPNHPGETTLLLCGSFHFEHADDHPLLSLLPRLIHIPCATGDTVAGLRTLLSLMAQEAGSKRPGSETLLRRLADALFVQVLRYWIENQREQAAGWLGALSDTQIGSALTLIHSQPSQAWSVASLATHVAMSRSSFAARFSTLVGEPPMEYLTRWRMSTAARLLRSNQLALVEIAERVGYESEVAFNKAFKRQVGVAPGAYRRQLQQAVAA